MARWLDLVQRARLAEVRQELRANRVSEQEVLALVQKVGTVFKEKGQLPLFRVLQDPERPKGEPRFDAEVMLMEAILSLPPVDTARATRWLAQSLVQ